jgi:tetratricopeptide (TPR) repeat protein
MGYFRLSLLPSLFIFVSVVVAHGQGQNSLQGRVISPDGNQPVSPVKVTLTFSGRRVFETFSDLSGRYSFSGLVRGTYQLTAEGDGQTFETTSVSFQLSQFGSSGQLFTQDIQLRAIRGKSGVARVGVVNAFTQDVPKSARDKFERAQKLASEGKGEMVLAQLQDAVKVFPQYFEAHLMIGNHLIQAGRLDEAIPPLDRAREINPNDERVYQSFGLLMMKQRKYPIAVAIFEEAARLNPTNPLNPLMRASALIYQASYVDPANVTQRNGLLNQAELALTQASGLSDKKLKLDPLTSAMFYELKGKPSRAADELEDYLRKTPTAKNVEAIKNEISRLKSKATKVTP